MSTSTLVLYIKTLETFTLGVNIDNILSAAFMSADLKSAKNTIKPSVSFAPLGSACVKTLCKIL